MLSPAYCPVLVTFHHSCLSLCLPDHLSGWLPQFTGDSFTVRQSPLSEAYTVSQPWDGWIQWLQQAQIIIIIILIDSHFISIITNYTVSSARTALPGNHRASEIWWLCRTAKISIILTQHSHKTSHAWLPTQLDTFKQEKAWCCPIQLNSQTLLPGHTMHIA